MPDNRFRTYLFDDRDERSPRYKQQLRGMRLAQDDRRSSLQRTELGVGLGVLAFGAYRTGALRNVVGEAISSLSRMRGTGAKAFFEGANQWLATSPDLPSVRLGKFQLFNRTDDYVNVMGIHLRAGKPTEAFEGLRGHILSAYDRIKQQDAKPLGGVASPFENLLKQFSQGHSTWEYQAADAVRFNRMYKSVTDTYGNDSQMADVMRRIVQDKGGAQYLPYVTPATLKKDFWDISADVRQELWQHIEPYQIKHNRYTVPGEKNNFLFHFRDAGEFTEQEKALVQQSQAKARGVLDDVLVNTLKVDEELNQQRLVRTGLRQATVGDLLKHGELQGKSQRTGLVPFDIDAELSRLRKARKDVDINKLSAGQGLFVNERGELVDLRHITESARSSASGFAKHFQIPFVNINPMRMLHISTIEDIHSQSQVQFLNMGAVQPGLFGGARTPEEIAYVGGRVVSLMDPTKTIAEDVYASSAVHGSMPKALAKMLGVTNRENVMPSEGWRRTLWNIGNFLDIGMQENPNIAQSFLSIFTKGKQDYYEGNWLKGLLNQTFKDDVEGAELFNKAREFIDSRGKPLSNTVYNQIRSNVDQFYNKYDIGIDLTTNEATLETLQRLVNAHESNLLTLSDQYRNRLQRVWYDYRLNPEQFMNGLRVITNKAPIDNLRDTSVVESIDDLRKTIQKETLLKTATNLRDAGTSWNPYREVQQAYEANKIGSTDLANAKDTLLGWMYESIGIYNADDASQTATSFIRSIGQEGTTLNLATTEFAARHTPPWQLGHFTKPDRVGAFGADSTLIIRKARPLPAYKEWIAAINDETKAQAVRTQTMEWAKQFTAGRNDFEDVTTATLFPYYFFERLNEGLSPFGLALSNQSLGSAGQIFGSFLTKRVLPLTLGMGYLGYLNWETENLTGVNPRDAALGAVKGAHLGSAAIRDALGITGWAKDQFRLMPGFQENLSEVPGLGFFDPSKSQEDLEDWYENGEEPVRKGRYWTLGNTPFTGGKVMYYQPNWYRRMQSDYKMTDSLYGSEGEYYANTWFPTPRYPLAPLNHFLLDPYHWEKKHYYDRPYMETGPISEIAEVPLIGPLLTPVSNMLKPPRKMHRAMLAGQNEATKREAEQREAIESQYGVETGAAVGEGSAYAYITSSGKIQLRAWVPGSVADDMATEDEMVAVNPNLPASGGSLPLNANVVMDSSAERGAPAGRAEVAHINEIIKARALGQKVPGGVLTRIPFAVNTSTGDPLNTGEMMTSHGVEWNAGRLYYNITEMGGFYGFGLTSFTGDILDNKPVIQDASRMYGYERSFWDEELGGLGGGLSEIARRFIPHRRRQIDEYNPIPNTMPDWLPGPEYFQNFQTGDPYTKIEKGEMRLPGEGYEAINKLHPDQLGRYGTFDRFKILADVAPYSDQYGYYSKLVSQMELPEDMQEEVNEIRGQVSSMKRSRRFFPYQFKYADIDKMNVTVTQVIDANTFFVNEFPDNPIKLAGVKVSTAKDADTAGRDYLAGVLYPGAQIKIGVADDERNRVRNDTYHSIKAVVYAGNQNVNYRLISQGLGKENEDDDSAAGINARFTPGEIREGKVWEALLHRDTPIHTKFMQVRSPLEDYMRREVYGKDWQTWDSPWSSYVVPTYESFINKSPILAAGLGAFFGSRFGSDRFGRRLGGIAGGLIMGLGAMERGAKETITGDKWIPERRIREREVNEYFDILNYLKYKGLATKYAALAEAKEGVDVNEFNYEQLNSGKARKQWMRTLDEQKRRAFRSGDKERIKEINKQLNDIKSYRSLIELGPYTVKALQYKQAYETTLYGADPFGPWQNVISALPKKEREYFNAFVEAAPEEREQIIRLVPENERRFLQAKWGMEVDKKESLERYFKTHYLPGPNWEGWEETKSLEDIKVRVVKNESLDTSEFNIWPDDEARAEVNNAPSLPVQTAGITDPGVLRRQIEEILKGHGLTDIFVDVVAAETPGMNVNMELLRDRREEIREHFNNNMSRLFAM